jgi:hypothetical protein
MSTLKDNLVLSDRRITDQDNSTVCGHLGYDIVLIDGCFSTSRRNLLPPPPDELYPEDRDIMFLGSGDKQLTYYTVSYSENHDINFSAAKTTNFVQTTRINVY